jgi:uncharacterized membrane protein YqaE (UPF0057 family)
MTQRLLALFFVALLLPFVGLLFPSGHGSRRLLWFFHDQG